MPRSPARKSRFKFATAARSWSSFPAPEQAQKLAAAAAHIPTDVRYVSYEPCGETINGQKIGLLSDLTAQASEADGKAIEAKALKEIRPTDLATILYTSGTTGDPKGVMLSHRNLTFNSRAVLEIFEAQPNDVRLTWLPLSHIYARTSDLYLWVAAGGEIALSPSRDTIIADCQTIKPHYINGVPYFYDKVMRTLKEKGVADQPGVLAATFGGRIKMACAGGAALPDYVNEFYEKHGVLLVQGYGLTESSPVISTGTRRASQDRQRRPADPGRRGEDRRRRRDPDSRAARHGRLLELAGGYGAKRSKTAGCTRAISARWKTAT